MSALFSLIFSALIVSILPIMATLSLSAALLLCLSAVCAALYAALRCAGLLGQKIFQFLRNYFGHKG